MAIDTIGAGADIKRRMPIRASLQRIFLACRAWRMKRRTRRSLLDLTEGQLSDIGISRGEARREVGKSFYWD